jgi:hypothetical protein
VQNRVSGTVGRYPEVTAPFAEGIEVLGRKVVVMEVDDHLFFHATSLRGARSNKASQLLRPEVRTDFKQCRLAVQRKRPHPPAL